MNWFVDICRIHNLIILPGARPRRRGPGLRGRGVMHVGETPRYKQIDHTISGLIALQADELHYKPKVRSIRRILSTHGELLRREYKNVYSQAKVHRVFTCIEEYFTVCSCPEHQYILWLETLHYH